MKYNLTLLQKLSLPFIWLAWQAANDNERKETWHLVKKGMEHHECNFNGKILIVKGCRFQECSHEGCNMVHILDI